MSGELPDVGALRCAGVAVALCSRPRICGSPSMKKSICLLAATILVGCASHPAPVAAPRQVKVDATNVADVQHAGYKIVDKDGQKLYCRRDLVTGSRVKFNTTCLTEEELAMQAMRVEQGLERNNALPQTGSGR